MKPSHLIQLILNTLPESRTNNSYNKEIFKNDSPNLENEFLFFIKPEITLESNQIKLKDILSLMFEKLDEHKFTIKNIRLVNAAYLRKHHIINKHYGVISNLSSDIKKNITQEAKKNFHRIFDKYFEEVEILGSIEFLNKYKSFTPASLSKLWQSSAFEKLSGGTYAQKLTIDSKQVFLVNGFHPEQLEHFYKPNRSILTMSLTSNTNWNTARNKFIGKTNPKDAESGSIRNELLLNKDRLGLDNVSSSNNGVHLSAGPIEALIELMRYNSDFDKYLIAHSTDFEFGKTLNNMLGKSLTSKILLNPNIEIDGKDYSIFDITEEMNTKECISFLCDKVYKPNLIV